MEELLNRFPAGSIGPLAGMLSSYLRQWVYNMEESQVNEFISYAKKVIDYVETGRVEVHAVSD
jgi:hypothetical protein